MHLPICNYLIGSSVSLTGQRRVVAAKVTRRTESRPRNPPRDLGGHVPWLGLLVFLFFSFLAAEANAQSASAAQTRAAFLKIIERPRVALASEVKEISGTNGVVQFQFSFASDAEQRVPGILLKRKGPTKRMPVVISLHGTGGTKESQIRLLRDLTGRGFIGVAIDTRYHGARTKIGKGSAEYQEAILRAWRDGHEHPLFYDTVWDVMRLIDYLETRDDVDPRRIGLIGFSKGGIETYFAAAAEARIACAVSCIGVQSFRWALENNTWKSRVETFQNAIDRAAKDAGLENPTAEFAKKFYDRVTPGIYNQFDGPAMLPLIAPRPLLVINGDSDPRTPLAGVRASVEAARPLYHIAGAEEKLSLVIQENTGHKVTPQAQQQAIEWFVRWFGAK